MFLAHLSDLHIRDEHDAIELGRQLDRIVARGADHLVITGDLLDRWSPLLLDHALDLLGARGMLDAERLTIIHGNHDIASSGGHPRERADLWRMAARFWDPPPALEMRKRAFYRQIARRGPGIGLQPATIKSTRSGFHFATVDTVRSSWLPLRVGRGVLTLRHGEGGIPTAQTDWLSRQAATGPLIVLIHHYPLPAGSFTWRAASKGDRRGVLAAHRHWQVVVRMDITPADRARFWEAVDRAGATAVLCGHVHRARLERRGAVALGLNGQSGAAWAGRTIAYYRLADRDVSVEYEAAANAA